MSQAGQYADCEICDLVCDKINDCNIEKLQHHYSTTIGLWCIDRDPKSVDLEWIRKNAFQLKEDAPTEE